LPALPQEQGLLTERAISLNMAQATVQGAIEKNVSVHVIDADRQVKASVRDAGSSEVNTEVNRRKAYTALAYKRPSADMEKAWATRSPSRILEGTFGVAVGLPVKVGNDTIGAIGVGGALGWRLGRSMGGRRSRESCRQAEVARPRGVPDCLRFPNSRRRWRSFRECQDPAWCRPSRGFASWPTRGRCPS
jgi:uncharacterized protein GlcG (DUF336 family)